MKFMYRLGFFSFTGQCKTLSEFEGEVFLSFTQTRWTLLGQRTFLARAYLDTMQESMSVTNRDEVVLSKASSDSLRGIRCGPPAEVFIHCIEIDPVTGHVIDFHR